MKIATISIAAATIFFAAASQCNAAQLTAPIAICIRDNAPKVEQAIPSLIDATTFLVGYICAEPVMVDHADHMKQMMQRIADDERKACEAQRATRQEGPQPRTHSADADPCELAASYSFAANSSSIERMRVADTPAAATTFAAKLLLDLRLARQARDAHH